jgi:hypothetical protein
MAAGKKELTVDVPTFGRSNEPSKTVPITFPQSSYVKLAGYAMKEGSTPALIMKRLWAEQEAKLIKDGYEFPEFAKKKGK